MASLTDPLPPEQRQLLRIIAEGLGDTRNLWPVWQWVRMTAAAEDLDAVTLVTRLPTWQHHYRPVRAFGVGFVIPEDVARLELTVHGMWQADHPTTNALLDAFVATLAVAEDKANQVQPSPQQVITASLDSEQLGEQVSARTGTRWNGSQLFLLLRGEPATWGSVSLDTWDVTSPHLVPFLGVRSTEDYLSRLERLVGWPSVATSVVPLPPLALPEALDHLDLAWRLVTGQALMHVPRAAVTAKLALSVNSGEEFDSRVSALVDMLKTFQTPDGRVALFEVQTYLQQRLGEDAGRAVEAVMRLRDVLALRAGQQHAGADRRAANARTALGLVAYEGDWARSWEQLRGVVTDALTAIREEISSLMPD